MEYTILIILSLAMIFSDEMYKFFHLLKVKFNQFTKIEWKKPPTPRVSKILGMLLIVMLIMAITFASTFISMMTQFVSTSLSWANEHVFITVFSLLVASAINAVRETYQLYYWFPSYA